MKTARRLALIALVTLYPLASGCTIYIPAGNFLPNSGMPRSGIASQPQPVLRPMAPTPEQLSGNRPPAAPLPPVGPAAPSRARATPGEMGGLLGSR